MQRFLRNGFFLCGVLIAVALFSGCVPTMQILARSDGSYSVSYSATLGASFLDTIYAVTGAKKDSVIFDESQFQEQLSAAGLRDVSAKMPEPEKIVLTASLPSGSGEVFFADGMIMRTNKMPNAQTMEITFSRETLSAIYNALPEMTRAYIDLFMAPAFTGDKMTRQEYVELIGTVYGQPLADEIGNAQLTLVLFAPNKKSRKKFSVPLVDLLLLPEPMNFSVSW